MKAVAILLSVLFVLLQIRLWFGDGSVPQVFKLKYAVAEQKAIVDDLSKRNQMQDAEVQDLKHRLGALEERARNDLGMIQKGETFYQYDERITEAESKRAPLIAPIGSPPAASLPTVAVSKEVAALTPAQIKPADAATPATSASSANPASSANSAINPENLSADEQIKD